MSHNFACRRRSLPWDCLAAFAGTWLAFNIVAAPTDDVYLLGPDSLPHDGVPHGKITEPKNIPSQIFPGTSHMFTVYVPAQYDPAKPACLMIFQDGHAYADLNGEYRIPNVFDNLIYRREMPVTIAVFINPGHSTNQPDFSASNWDANSNRPEEYNVLDDRYSQVILQELMPELKRVYNISENPDDRALSGASSGAIAAFTVAWHHPDQFHKVITTIGSFTAIRGGDAYPSLISQSEKKPIRIFLEDGINDNRGIGGRGGRGGRGNTNAHRCRRRTGSQHQQLQPRTRLARPKHPDGGGANGEGLRCELCLDPRHPFQQTRRCDHAGNVALALARLPPRRQPAG